MLQPSLRSFMRRAFFLVVILSFFLLPLNLVASTSAEAYSLGDLKQQATKAKTAIIDTTDNISGSIKAISGVGTEIGSQALHKSKATLDGAIQIGAKVGSAGVKAGKTATYRALGASEVIGEAALHASKTAADMAIDTTSVVSSKALNLGATAIGTVEDVSSAAAKETVLLMGQALEDVQSSYEAVARQIIESFERYAQPLLEVAIAQVDLKQIEVTVKRIQQGVAEHTPEALVKLLIDQKVIEASAAENWLETARLQAELVYQIAAVYGFSPDDEKRKQEILDIAAANLGSSQLLGNSIPLVKYAIGFAPGGNVISILMDASSDRIIRALMFPLLGQSAHKYYGALQVSVVKAKTPSRDTISVTAGI